MFVSSSEVGRGRALGICGIRSSALRTSCSNLRKAASFRSGAKSSIRLARMKRALSGRNDLRRRPFSPLASRSAAKRTRFGSGSTSGSSGRFSGATPFGFPAAVRIAPSSKSSHASVMRTGTTQTWEQGVPGCEPGHAASISLYRNSGSCASASRCTSRTLHGYSSKAREILSFRTFGGLGKTDKSAVSPRTRTSVGRCCSKTHRAIGSRARSDPPSANRAKLTSITGTLEVWEKRRDVVTVYDPPPTSRLRGSVLRAGRGSQVFQQCTL